MARRAEVPAFKVNIKVMAVVAAIAVTLVAAWLAVRHVGFGSPRTTPVAAQLPPPAVASPGHAGHTAGASRAPANRQPARAAGPITELDKELLVKVRQANLWELQAGRLAQENGSSEAVKRAGLHLLDGHSRLDQIVREMSEALDIPIPDEPTAEQQQWVKQMRESKGAEFDRFFANQLRVAHGKVFVVVAQVRSTTQNSMIRDLAIEANIAVSDHLQVLEDTGLVNGGTFDELTKAVVKK